VHLELSIDTLLRAMVEHKASDLYLNYGYAPTLRVGNELHPMPGAKKLDDSQIAHYIEELTNSDQRDSFYASLELNTAYEFQGTARFRINAFRQQQHYGMVIRRIQTDIPSHDSLGLPDIYANLALSKRGLIIIAGPTGSGKSTTVASMIGHCNTHGSGHIITVEDPIEYVYPQGKCIITQRDVGLDTHSFAAALKNALRQRPDIVVIGEVRDREVMEQALYFADTGHLCIATLHASNAPQAVERMLNFFPEERHAQVLQHIALNLVAVLTQRLVNGTQVPRLPAVEIMLNRGLIKQWIEEGKLRELKDLIEKGTGEGMSTLDQSLYQMFLTHQISADTALREAENIAGMRLLMKKRTVSAQLQQEQQAESRAPINADPKKSIF
jgi:twitching motility protein PilU